MPTSSWNQVGVARAANGLLHYDDVPRTLNDVLLQREVDSRDADAVAVIGGSTVTFSELATTAREVAGGFRAAGVERGDRIAIVLGNGMDWVTAYWGALLAGAIAVPINTRLSSPEVDAILEDCEPAIVVRGPSDLPRAAAYLDESVEGSDMAAIFYTSGTTGKPKGVCQTHTNLVASCENFRRVLAAGMGDPRGSRTLISVPLFHVTGCNTQLLTSLYVGGTSVVMPVFEIGAFLDALRTQRIDLLVSVPTIFWRVLQDPAFGAVDTSGIRALLYGGAPAPSELVERIAAAFPSAWLGNGFGCTESVGVLSCLPHQYALSRSASVGEPVPVVEVRIDAPDATGVGELLVRGSSVSGVYWRDPVRTAEVLADGWLRTGDLARLDDDLIYVVDRLKDMISRGGEKVFCVEVENALASVEGVLEVAVLGVPDHELGERVAAVVVGQPGSAMTAEHLIESAHAHLAPYKVPEYVVVSDDPLPRNAGGKVVKPQLRDSIDWDAVPVRRHSPKKSGVQ